MTDGEVPTDKVVTLTPAGGNQSTDIAVPTKATTTAKVTGDNGGYSVTGKVTGAPADTVVTLT
ncbi:hypothetical protein, partial [Secundilactobacillus odoratitofui]|uniref:hypothetical protein n=1 Tax=Secundilactobacillus odoratitofui TaxID=480930 RepID=UPI001F46EFC4